MVRSSSSEKKVSLPRGRQTRRVFSLKRHTTAGVPAAPLDAFSSLSAGFRRVNRHTIIRREPRERWRERGESLLVSVGENCSGSVTFVLFYFFFLFLCFFHVHHAVCYVNLYRTEHMPAIFLRAGIQFKFLYCIALRNRLFESLYLASHRFYANVDRRMRRIHVTRENI